MNKTWNRILILVVALIFLVSGGMILRYFIASRQAVHQYDQLARQVHQAEKDTETSKNGISENKVLPQYQKLLKQT